MQIQGLVYVNQRNRVFHHGCKHATFNISPSFATLHAPRMQVDTSPGLVLLFAFPSTFDGVVAMVHNGCRHHHVQMAFEDGSVEGCEPQTKRICIG